VFIRGAPHHMKYYLSLEPPSVISDWHKSDERIPIFIIEIVLVSASSHKHIVLGKKWKYTSI